MPLEHHVLEELLLRMNPLAALRNNPLEVARKKLEDLSELELLLS